MSITRDDIVRQARSWSGTPFKHQGRLKNSESIRGGCDCIGLIIGVLQAFELAESVCKGSEKNADYPRLPDGKTLKKSLDNALIPIKSQDMQQGDVLLFKLEEWPQHVGFVSKKNKQHYLIHAYAASRKVVEHRLDQYWVERIVQAYRLPIFKH